MNNESQMVEFQRGSHKYVITYDELISTCSISITNIKRLLMWKAIINNDNNSISTELTPKGVFEILTKFHNRLLLGFAQLHDNIHITLPSECEEKGIELFILIKVNVEFGIELKKTITLYPEDLSPETLNVALFEQNKKEIIDIINKRHVEITETLSHDFGVILDSIYNKHNIANNKFENIMGLIFITAVLLFVLFCAILIKK